METWLSVRVRVREREGGRDVISTDRISHTDFFYFLVLKRLPGNSD